MSSERPVVGLVGLGQMGGSMCRTLLRGGWRVVAWDPSTPAMQAVETAGAELASAPVELASRAELVILSVPDADAVREATLGARGLAGAGRLGLLVIDTSTLLAGDARAVSEDLAAAGVAYLDAPVSGGVKGADAGTLSIMVGGSAVDVERARPVLSCLGSTVVHCGPTGAGQVAKACNQVVVMATHAAVAEALVLAEASGLDPWLLRDLLMGGYGASRILEVQGPKMLSGDFAPGGRSRFHLKDIAAVAELASAEGLHLPVFEAAAGQFERLVRAGGGDLDNSAVITMVRDRPQAGDADGRHG